MTEKNSINSSVETKRFSTGLRLVRWQREVRKNKTRADLDAVEIATLKFGCGSGMFGVLAKGFSL